MMFLQFFVWGAWYTSIAVYMTNHGMEKLTHWPYTVNPIAAIVAPFFLGLVADRYFATEKVLGVLHLLGGVVMFAVPQATGAPAAFILLLLVYNLCYMPTLGLANSLAFHHIQSQEQQFPLIRVFGTIGWIVAGLSIDFVLGPMLGSGPVPEQTALPIYTTATASVLLGLFAFSLPHTPPPGAGQRVSLRSIVGLDVQATQSLGQMSEVIFMLLMPLFFVRLGVKRMLMVGMGAWTLRYALFALAAPHAIFWLIAIGILLHGVCYDFFFVTGQIYVDKKSTPAVRGQAQGFLVLVTYGIGMLIGAQVAGNVYNRILGGATSLTLDQWPSFWVLPAGFAAVVLVFFAVLFRPPAMAPGAGRAPGKAS